MNQNEVKEHFGRQADGYDELMVKLILWYLEQHKYRLFNFAITSAVK